MLTIINAVDRNPTSEATKRSVMFPSPFSLASTNHDSPKFCGSSPFILDCDKFPQFRGIIDAMPTPFMHMALAHRLISDPVLPDSHRNLLRQVWGPFLLGSIAPDARVSSGMSRADTHFFEYVPDIDPPPVTAMLQRHPSLCASEISDNQRRAFVAGYAAHLTMDEGWCSDLLYPVFIEDGTWAKQSMRFLLLHIVLSTLDARDRALLSESDYEHLAATTPDHWLPFMSDEALIGWRDTIAPQLAPGGRSLTVDILASRMSMTADALVEQIHAGETIGLFWQRVPPEQLAEVEEHMYTATRATIIDYLNG